MRTNCAGYSLLPNLLPMPPNNSNLTSALSRQMQSLRQQVDRIDLKILRLLQQRTKLSVEIGKTKHRHKAAIYVPERERELFAHLTRLSKGKLSPKAVMAIYREILSSSRTVQGQPPIGLLGTRAESIIPAARWCFGACDEFSSKKNWGDLASGLKTGILSLALITGKDLAQVLAVTKTEKEFEQNFTVVGDFSPTLQTKVSLAQRVFIVMPGGKGAASQANRFLILMECKSTVNAVKRLAISMPDRFLHAEQLSLRAPSARGVSPTLVRLTLAAPLDGIDATRYLLAASKSAGFPVSILGIYPGTENYGG